MSADSLMQEIVDMLLAGGTADQINFDEFFSKHEIDVNKSLKLGNDIYRTWAAAMVRPNAHKVSEGLAAKVVGPDDLIILTTIGVLLGMLARDEEKFDADLEK